ncbi:uncharacterized protein LOC119766415 [Culex quinquefasciatus]|uniref:uncharacterized protein LOC119766415 n=1 Tax=Culex quinquefasciatus TaxID=7176 RepID=UPI0018E38788|nr:uncharacterized protein LOC119766415 [Culex quinquefasciatus]
MFNLNVFTVLAILAVTNSKASFTPGQLAIFHESVGPCSERLNIPDYLHLEERIEDFDPTLVDDQFKKFLLCLLSGMKLVDEHGAVRHDEVVTFSKDGQDVSSLHKALDGCTEEKDTPEEKVFHFYHCFFKQKFFTV